VGSNPAWRAIIAMFIYTPANMQAVWCSNKKGAHWLLFCFGAFFVSVFFYRCILAVVLRL
jgi:hypothetical protein